MVKTLILYQSKYGFTEMIAKSLSLVLGPAKYCKTSELKGNYNDFEVIVICTPVYSEVVDNNILEYVTKNADWLKQKKVVLICTCLAENRTDHYLKPLKNILGQSVRFEKAIGGELFIDKLSKPDFELLKRFCDKTGFPFKDHHLFNKGKFIELALDIKKIKDEGPKVMEEPILRTHIENFIKAHNTCTLATGHEKKVRATPIEYTWMDDCLYVLSEGGEKFANILLNPNVSVCIYDPYKKMNELGGMQIMGVAEIVDIGSDEYISLLAQKELKFDRIISLPVALNLIKIRIQKIEFLWSGFEKLGYDVKQILVNKEVF
jgi:menaquinone-dependent protoporphyrinogen IX oxidase/uncharacterized protein YhbP (UPF0306 family)